jgi:hypothetical protein
MKKNQDSTVHGLHNIIKTGHPSIRITWSILVLTAVTFSALLAARGILAFMRHNVTTTIRVTDEASLTLPMLTICNSKPFATQTAYDYFITKMLQSRSKDKLTDDFISVLYGNYTDPSKIENFRRKEQSSILMLQSQVGDSRFNTSLRSSFGLTKNQFVLNKSFPVDTAMSLELFRVRKIQLLITQIRASVIFVLLILSLIKK